MDDALKPVLARQMEVYAAYLEYADHHVGRVLDALSDLEILDDTLVYYVIGDRPGRRHHPAPVRRHAPPRTTAPAV